MTVTMYLMQIGYVLAAVILTSNTQHSTILLDDCEGSCNVTIMFTPEVPDNTECDNVPEINATRCLLYLMDMVQTPRSLLKHYLYSKNEDDGNQGINASLHYISEVINAQVIIESANDSEYNETVYTLNKLYCDLTRQILKVKMLIQLKKQYDNVSQAYVQASLAAEGYEKNRTWMYLISSKETKVVYLHLLNNFRTGVLRSKKCNHSAIDNRKWIAKLLNVAHWDSIYAEEQMNLYLLERDIQRRAMLSALRYGVQPFLSAVIFLLGVCLNGLLLVIFIRQPDSRAPRNMILLQLAVGDTLSLTVNLPVYHLLVLLNLFPKEQELQRFVEFLRYMCFGISVFSVVALNFQRYCATLKLTNRGMILRQSTRFSSTLVIVTVWIFASVMAVYHAFHCFDHSCYSQTAENVKLIQKINYLLDFLFLACIPLLLITSLSLLTVRHFHLRLGQLKDSVSQEVWENMRQALARSTTVLKLTPLVFGTSFVPFYLLNVVVAWENADINSSWYNYCSIVTYLLVFLQACFNPISLYVTSSTFRGYFRVYMFCRRYGPLKNYRFDLQPVSFCATEEVRFCSLPEETELQKFSSHTGQD